MRIEKQQLLTAIRVYFDARRRFWKNIVLVAESFGIGTQQLALERNHQQTHPRSGRSTKQNNFTPPLSHSNNSKMASVLTSEPSLVYSRRVVEARVHKYHWPAVQLNIWMLIMLISACTIIGVFATFIDIQHTLLLPVPWSVVLPPPSLPILINTKTGTSPTT